MPPVYRIDEGYGGDRPYRCMCPGLTPSQRHTTSAECLPAETLADWRLRHPEATCGDHVARCLAELEEVWDRGF